MVNRANDILCDRKVYNCEGVIMCFLFFSLVFGQRTSFFIKYFCIKLRFYLCPIVVFIKPINLYILRIFLLQPKTASFCTKWISTTIESYFCLIRSWFEHHRGDVLLYLEVFSRTAQFFFGGNSYQFYFILHRFLLIFY